jgi:hypothetical protein
VIGYESKLMNTRERIEKRFKELVDELLAVKGRVAAYGPDSVEAGKWYGWCTSAMHLIKMAFGQSSVHFTEFEKSVNVGGFSVEVLDWLNGIFLAAKADYEGGYAVKIEGLRCCQATAEPWPPRRETPPGWGGILDLF